MGIIRGMMYIFEEVARRAEDEIYDEDGTRRELISLHQALESGALPEAEFERREEELLARLEIIIARKRQGRGRAQPSQ